MIPNWQNLLVTETKLKLYYSKQKKIKNLEFNGHRIKQHNRFTHTLIWFKWH